MSRGEEPVVVYTDGACVPNPGGPGGYGVVLLHAGARRELSGGFRTSTNNRMELWAAIKGLEALPAPSRVVLYSDSAYLVNAMTQGWAKRWRENGWRRRGKQIAENADLWEKLLDLCDRHHVTFVWVKGHSTDDENKICDRLALAALKQPNLPPDNGYEQRLEVASAAPKLL